MAAGGFREFVAGETLDEDAINDYLMQGVLVFAGTAARGSAITAPVEGQFAWLNDSDQLTYYSGSAWEEFVSESPEFNFVVVAGGGGGGRGITASGVQSGAGGGAGGYLCSVTGELTGGSASALPPVRFNSGDSFEVTVGAGGAGTSSSGVAGTRGNESVCGPVVAVGGGGGSSSGDTNSQGSGQNGGSGGGRYGTTRYLGKGFLKQGFDGGNGTTSGAQSGGGGGGAGALGGTSATSTGANGGAGLASSITGSSVTRAGGGGGGGYSTAGGLGGAGGGGNGAVDAAVRAATTGTVNTGGGGGGNCEGQSSAAGGSGIVILKYPDTITLTIGAGLTSSTSTSGGFKITSFTAGTDSVTVG